MMNINGILGKNEKGATAVYAAVVLAMLLMFAALGVDVNYLYGVRNELHNAADAGSLAGASVLFNIEDGTLNRDAAIAEATRVAITNTTGNQAVVAGNVETGHWSFTTKTFTANATTTQTEWQERSSTELDLDPAFINAVRVQADRSDTPSFFARLLGHDSFFVSADAVAYRGFAGNLFPADIDQPIAICEQSITDPDGSYSCNMGRMLNSGGNTGTSNTGGWTNFTQPCSTASASDMKALVCTSGNDDELTFGQGIGATNGVQDSTLSKLYDCWAAATGKNTSWDLRLPVIDCPANSVSNCPTLLGALVVKVVWIVEKNDPQYKDVPREMTVTNEDGTIGTSYICDPDSEVGGGFGCWKKFVDDFELANVDGPPLSDTDYEEMYQNKNIFFLPSCEYTKPIAASGGHNFGILARIPKLVE